MSYVIEPPAFDDRSDAGRQLVNDRLKNLPSGDWVVIAISRDALPIAAEVARTFRAPLDLQIVASLPAPEDLEHHFGAIALDGTIVDNDAVWARLGLSQQDVGEIARRVHTNACRDDARLHEDRPHVPTRDRNVLLVDDGTSAGFALLAGIHSLRAQGVRQLVVALPVAAASTIEQIKPFVDDAVAIIIRESPHFAPTAYYRNWSPVEDAEAAALLLGA